MTVTATMDTGVPLGVDGAGGGTVLDVDDLTVAFRGKRRTVEVVRGVTLSVERGQTLVLLGESGSGKSVTARALLGLLGPAAAVGGAARLGGRSLLGLDEAALAKVRGVQIGMVPQDPTGALDPLRRIGRQVAEVLRVHGVVTSRTDAARRAEELLAGVGIADPRRVTRSYPHELSGGMRQRAVIALAVACSPQMLIADEPTTALDVTIQAQVLDLFSSLQRDRGMGMLLVTHDVGVARQVGDRVAVMYAGRIVEEGPAAEVLDHPRHPYTTALLAAVPTPEVARGEMLAIPGRPPSPAEVPAAACAFAPRCARATDECLGGVPVPVSVGRDHQAACVHAAATPARQEVQ